MLMLNGMSSRNYRGRGLGKTKSQGLTASVVYLSQLLRIIILS